jgi:N,N'-diacetyllegionaminate synthase
MNTLNIGSRTVGPGESTLVIAELGVNHDGSVHRALELVRIAANCGADAVKLQIFHAVHLMNASSVLAEYQKGRTNETSPIDMLKKYELSTAELRQVVREITALKMIPLATPFSPADLEIVQSLHLPAIKIASPDLVNRPLLQAAALLRKPLLVSTGASDMHEVETTVQWLDGWNAEYSLLHCVSAYPTPRQLANLCWIGELASRFNVPIGYSDHTTDMLSGALSVAAGASVVEKHITYDCHARGPDHSSSIDATHFQRYVKSIRDAETLCGAAGKRVLEIEQDVRKVSRQSLVARRSLLAGDVLREEDLTVQRPGTGVPAGQIAEAVGRRIIKPVTAGTLLQWDMLDAA